MLCLKLCYFPFTIQQILYLYISSARILTDDTKKKRKEREWERGVFARLWNFIISSKTKNTFEMV